MSLRIALLLAAIIFLATIAARLPASMLISRLPPNVHCEEPAGTIWHGGCGVLGAEGVSIPQFSWTLHPLPLLRLAISADLQGADPNNGGSATVLLGHNGDLTASAVQAVVPLGPTPSFLPAGITATLTLALPAVAMQGDHLTRLSGTAELHNVHVANPALDLGSFQVQLAPESADATVTDGRIHDLDGPLKVDGLLHLQQTGNFEINGTVAPRSTASDDLSRTLQMFLGPADAQGQHAFSMSGSL
jgi:type II secretion system (T2SS) protein N